EAASIAAELLCNSQEVLSSVNRHQQILTHNLRSERIADSPSDRDRFLRLQKFSTIRFDQEETASGVGNIYEITHKEIRIRCAPSSAHVVTGLCRKTGNAR